LFFASLYTQNDPSIPAGGGMAHIISQMAANPPAIAQYHLPLIAYEGGQGFVSFPHGMNANNTPNAMTNLFVAANNDPRMQAAYAQYLEGWKKIGGQLFMQFNDISPYNQYGEWGALQSIMQTTSPLTSAPPKWQALQGFISGNACWWAGCVGSIATTPMAPSSLRAAQ
jgi:hypothetical protein